jgi:hypothetical protein
MDGLTFAIRLIEAVTWPVAAGIILLVFRPEVRQLLSLVRKLKAGPLEAEFEREIREISQEEARGATTPEIEKKPDPIKTTLIELAEQHPRSAILEAWRRVEAAVVAAAVTNAIRLPSPDASAPVRAISELARQELVSPGDLALFHDLRGLRNQAAHVEAFEPSADAVLEYVQLARVLELRLRRLTIPRHAGAPLEVGGATT